MRRIINREEIFLDWWVWNCIKIITSPHCSMIFFNFGKILNSVHLNEKF
jgi:hypothetical protein